jgi:Carboxypeptidase regulatory-like domain/TonB-dependent Receptor Plug Domain
MQLDCETSAEAMGGSMNVLTNKVRLSVTVARMLLLVALGFALTVDARPLSAQTTSGSIYGTVADTTGAIVPTADLTVTNVATGVTKSTKANDKGEYTFPVLDPGDYKVAVQMTGFQSQTQTGVRLDANQNVHVNFSLQVGSMDQSITVQGDTTLVDTRESQIGNTIDQKRIEDLPLNGRNAYDLLTILPGVTNYAPDVQTGSRQGTQIIVNGVPSQSTAYYLDGSYDTNVWRFGGNLLPNPDSLQEFRVLTSNYDAEFGRSAGGVVSAITRSGTSKYHGLIYDYLRNNVFNAKNYFLTSVTPLRQNQFGATFGGPAPLLRDKAFFFLSYQGLRIRQPANVASAALITPTALERQGDFRSTPANLRPNVSCNGTQYVICANLLDPVAQNLLVFVPVGSSTASNYGHPSQQSDNGNITSDQGMARFDYHLGQKHQLSAMYFESRGTSNTPTVSGNQILSFAGMANYEGQYNTVVTDTWAVSPSKVNDVRAYYSLNHYIIGNIYGDQHLLPSLGSKAAQGGNYNAQPLFNVQGYWQMGTNNAGPNNLPSSTLGISDTFYWNLRRHELKIGGAYMFDRFTSTGGGSSNGLFTFTGSTTGNALADFLEGHANTLVQNNGVFFRTHSVDPSLFVQDNWKITARLSLNLGIRWEYYPMYTGQNNSGTFVPGVQSTRFPNAPRGLLTSGDAGVPDGILHTPWNTFAPRFGFAYDVFGDGKTSLRGAYGIFYNAVPQVAVSNNLVQQPFSRSVTVNKTPNLVTPFAPGVDPFPYTPSTTNAVFLTGANLFGLPPNEYHIPSVQMFSLGVQQQYSSRWSSELSYIGNVGRHLYITTDVNSPGYSASCTSATCLSTASINNRRPYQPTPSTYTFASISVAAPRENTSYHSLQATLQRRFDHNFSLQASYVWSKVISLNPVVNQYDVRSSRGVDPTDVPNNFVVSYIYVTPTVNRLGFVGKQALSGWQLNGITHLQSGSPFNVTSGVDTNFDGTNNDRPNVVGIPTFGNRSRAQNIAMYFNTTAFAQTPAGQPYGNAQFDLLFGPKYVDTDLSAFKNFPIHDDWMLQFRAEAFNVVNNVNLSNPAASLTSAAQFGKITAANSPRILQFALRLSF